MTDNLVVTKRESVGKGAARKSRREGQVPGVIYGGGQDPIAIDVKQSELLRRLKQGKFLSTLHRLDLDGTQERVVCRNVQRNKINDLPIHVDFLRLAKGSKIALLIPVNFVNQDISRGIKRGGNLVVVRQEIELVVPADDIPEQVTIDLENVRIGEVINISDVTLPAGCVPTITDRDFVIANISAPTIMTEDDDADEDKAAEASENSKTEES